MQSSRLAALVPPKSVKTWESRMWWVRPPRTSMWHLTGTPESAATVATFCGHHYAVKERAPATMDKPGTGSQCANCLIMRRRVTQGCKGVA